MAEIKIEKKKPIWPWIILVLIILGIIAYFVYANQDNDHLDDDFDDEFRNEQVMDSTTNDAYDRDALNTSSTYDQYSSFEESIRDSTRIAMDSSYTKNAYYSLTKAVVEKAEENNLEDSSALSDLREFSTLNTHISSPSDSGADTKNFKTAGDKVVTVLEAIQTKNYPQLQSDVSSLKQLAAKVDGSMVMDKQQANINAFLQKSRDVLRSMNQ